MEQQILNHSHSQRHSIQSAEAHHSRNARKDSTQDELGATLKDQSNSDITGSDTQDGDQKRSMSGAANTSIDTSTLQHTATPTNTLKRAQPQLFSETPHTAVRVEASKKKAKTAKRNLWVSISRYTLSDAATQDGKPDYCIWSLIVKLRFSGRLVIPGTPTAHEQASAVKPRSASKRPRTVSTPTTPFVNQTLSTPRPESPASLSQNPGSSPGTWIDETQDFDVLAVRSTLRSPSTPVKDLGPHYTWYTDAVPVDALFPPGVPLSAKEILAYYPHHVRWKDVMLRLARSGYRGSEILGIQVCLNFSFHAHIRTWAKRYTASYPQHNDHSQANQHSQAFFRRAPHNTGTTTKAMNAYQRDTLRYMFPGFKTSASSSDLPPGLTQPQSQPATQHTTQLHPGKHISSHRPGFVLPSLDALVQGLQHLPSGLDARCLTECLAWYMRVRDTFTPRLELNVLHVQALTRALRIPVRSYGMLDLDVCGLQEWKARGGFVERVCLWGSTNTSTSTTARAEAAGEKENREGNGKTRLKVNVAREEVSLELRRPLRYVFMFPFVALHGVVEEALKMGIQRAEEREREREKAGRVVL